MRLGIAAVLVMLAGCAGLDRPAVEGYDNIRALISVTTEPQTGAVTASSAAAAKEEVVLETHAERAVDQFDLSTASAESTGRSRETAYVEAVRSSAGEVLVYIVSVERQPVSRTETSERPWTVTDPNRHGNVGDPWRRTSMELVELRFDCQDQIVTCTRHSTDRMVLTPDDVRALLASPRNDIPVNFDSWRAAAWRLDKDELLAVLDALGARERFR